MPERDAGYRRIGISAIDDLDRLHAAQVGLRLRTPAAAHAHLARGHRRVVDRYDHATLRQCFEQRVPVGHGLAAHAKVHGPSHAKDIGMPLEGGDFHSGDQQKIVEVGLKRAQLADMRDRVVLGHRHEVEPALHGAGECQKEWTGHACSAAARAASVAVSGMQMQVPAIPPLLRAQRGALHTCILLLRIGSREVQLRRELVLPAGANVGHSEQKAPAAGREDARKIGRRGIRRRNGERPLVAAAPATKSVGSGEAVRAEQADVDRRPFLAAGVIELDGDA